MSVAQWLCVIILEAGGLVSVQKDAILLNPAPTEKIDLMTLPIFIALQAYKKQLVG